MEKEKYLVMHCDCGEQFSVKTKDIDSRAVTLRVNRCPICMGPEYVIRDIKMYGKDGHGLV